ncbi:MAG: chemotaxis protein CheW [Verrucomicrobiae bacterium]
MNETFLILEEETDNLAGRMDLANAEPTRVFPGRVPAQEEPAGFNAELLDKLMNLASSLVLGRNKLVRFSEKEGSAVDGLRSIVQEINLVTSEMQSTIMRARLHPIGNLFVKFTNIVRDLGQKLHKEIQLDIVGDDVELDRMLIEGLADPLARIVHNCADHGIETPEERQTLGKPAAGRIRMAAAHLNGRVQIEVRDDGRGLAPEKLKAKAIKKGLLAPEVAAHMSAAEACQTLFMAGFSDSCSADSGRGIGMDVVKANIEKLGGDVALETEPGRGTAVIIRLPLTLAIIPALVVTCGGLAFAVPQINLEEIVVPGPNCPLESLGSGLVVRLREELLPVLDLAAILGQTQAAPEIRYVLVLQLDHARFGLLVDDISNTEEIVVKPLGRELKSVTIYSGATLLGQGDIALILDPAALAHGRLPSEVLGSAALQAPATLQARPGSERVLVFSDASPERFALPLSSITRIEHIPATRIERIGGRECLRQNNGPTLQLIRPGHFLPVTPPAPYGEEIFVIVPRGGQLPVGIIGSEIVDSADLETSMLDREMFSSTALLGAATLLERLTLVIDIEGLLRAAGFGESPVAALDDQPQ